MTYITNMSLKSIIIHPDPRLKKVCVPIGEVDTSVRKLAEDMLETMYDAPGIGLAAPQVGVMKRLFVADCHREEQPTDPTVFINPKITWTSEELNTYEEGCLSIPDLYADVTRPAEVRISYTDLEGKLQERECDALWATCVQHELDHLNGKLFIDYLSTVKRTMITNKMKKLKKERARA